MPTNKLAFSPKTSKQKAQATTTTVLKNYNIGVVQFNHSFKKNEISPVLGTKYM
jgi:hypothetical protein